MLDFTFATAKDVLVEFASRLKAHRMRQGLSQPELAQRAGLALGTVSGFEKDGKATFETVIRLVMALGLSRELQPLFLQIPSSIKELEEAQQPARKRVARKKRLT